PAPSARDGSGTDHLLSSKPCRSLHERIRRTAGFLAMAAVASAALAAEVRVIDPAGNPMQDVVVLCDGKSKGAVATDANGAATVADTCRKVQCLHGEFITGEAQVEGGKALCRLGAGVH